MSEVLIKAKKAKEISYQLISKTTDEKNKALFAIAHQLLEDEKDILAENAKDLQLGMEKGLDSSVLDRIKLDSQRLKTIHHAVLDLIELNDPIGEKLDVIQKENGLEIIKKRVPLGVIGIIYEARPNVTVDAASLTLKTGNAVILRGSSSAKYSNSVLVKSIQKALRTTTIPPEAVQLIEDTSRETASELFVLKEYLDVLIPRGSKALIDTVVANATVPVLETGAGNCHIFIDESADLVMAKNIVKNAKTQRTSVCNATESLLIHSNWYEKYGTQFIPYLIGEGIQLIVDDEISQAFPELQVATVEDWATEYLAMTLSVKLVQDLSDSIEHINKYGTNHSEAIITKDENNAQIFQTKVDAAAVYHNASTRFTDGFEFGYSAEIGISTQKLHARGPMGLEALSSTKYVINGSGQIRK
ncbi:gamma-glutamyl phosphate reductase [Kurthia zopfii]|uniref:Gamma-glutamyl phosphate reductase n=1 Tax=Kurthia zopfii TaxID=1650 RepID=A0A8B4QB05_9BACL|nr:glutamate-5-semialdehyde dehydrogenase [Kurthia zopfii]TDR41359.1 glutamate-5-semialdehyde dehydrogenase [Kurthia zopfii]GEK30001.1 gamma-glutamyl phosphate reductase [Kurthia zopfii]STX09864.1 Gamma-glutamyl phosphate reductase [Kurthia zopfii]VEI07292.1 Gamma-glutamyl phosphate reductase [Kurthia zopfii]